MPTPLTVEFIGTRADAAQAITNYTATKITGGGAGPSEALASLFKQGSAAIAMDYPSASKLQFLSFDDGGTTSFDFTSGGANEGQLIWVWGNALLAPTSTGTITSTARGGFGIVITDNANIANSWATWTFYGGENYPGGFQKMVIDPTTRPTQSGGTFGATSLSSIRGIGIFFVADSNAKGGADAAIIDAIDVGSGLRIYGSGTPDAGFKDLIDQDEGTANNQYGVIKSLNASSDIVQYQGVLEIGSGVNATTVFDDINRVVDFNNPQYIATDGTVRFANSIPTDFQKISIVGNSTSGTTVKLGEKVGAGDTARGRNGLTILGNNDYNIEFNFADANTDETLIYGTTIRNFRGGLNWNLPTSGHEFIGSVFDSCSQLDASSGVIIRNSTFLNSTGLEGAVVWNSGFNIKNSSFVSNTNSVVSGAAIEHPFSGTFIYDNLIFSDNDFDINFSLATSGDLLIQATNNANPATFKTANANSQVDIENTVVLTLTDIVLGSEVQIFKSDPTGTFPITLAGTESEDDGTFEYAYNFTGDFDVDIVVFKVEYNYFRTNNNTLTSTPNTIKINQVFDRNYENP
jgi:hypothetical protein